MGVYDDQGPVNLLLCRVLPCVFVFVYLFLSSITLSRTLGVLNATPPPPKKKPHQKQNPLSSGKLPVSAWAGSTGTWDPPVTVNLFLFSKFTIG